MDVKIAQIWISSLDHDSGKVTFLDIFHVTRIFQCVTHVPPSLKVSHTILRPTLSPFFEISKFQDLKNPARLPKAVSGGTVSADCRDLTRLCLRLFIGVKLSYRATQATPLLFLFYTSTRPSMLRPPTQRSSVISSREPHRRGPQLRQCEPFGLLLLLVALALGELDVGFHHVITSVHICSLV